MELESVAGELEEVRRVLAESDERRRAAMRGVVTEISAIVDQMESEYERALAAATRDPGIGSGSGEIDRQSVVPDGD